MQKIINYVAKLKSFISNNTDEAQRNKLQLLKNRFKGANYFIKKNTINKHGVNISLNTLPWYFLLGSPGAGKTSLLANSKVKYVLEKHFQYTNIKNLSTSESCDWWITPDTVIVDTPGSFILPIDNHANKPTKLWTSFLRLTSKARGEQALQGVIIAVSVAELIDNAARDQLIENLLSRITELQNHFGYQLPFYLVVTKADLIPGFIDFFHDVSMEELVQAWGITMPPLHVSQSLNEIFVQRFNALIKRLNSQVIWRLHQERNPGAKFYIKDFPLQLEHIKEGLSAILTAFDASGLHIVLKGAYLTSAIQDNATHYANVNPKILSIVNSNELMHLLRVPDMPINSYFIKQFLTQGIMQ